MALNEYNGLLIFLILMAVLLLSHGSTYGQNVDIVAVIDAKTPEVEKNLRSAVAYINTQPASAHNVKLKVVKTSSNMDYTVNAMTDVCISLQDGVSLVVDLSSQYVSRAIRAMVSSLGIPYVSSVDPSYVDSEHESNTSVNFVPPSHTMLQAIRDSVSQENLTNVGIIYDNTFDLENKPKRLLRNIPAQHMYLGMATGENNIREQLLKIKKMELQHLFLAASANNADIYLAQASDLGMMNFKYTWYVLTKDVEVSCTNCEGPATIVVMTAQAQFNRDPNRFSNRQDVEVGEAFQFDMMNFIGQALNETINEGSWNQINITECYNLTAPSPSDVRESTEFIKRLKRVSREGIFGDFSWTGASMEQDIILEIRRAMFENGSQTFIQMIGNWTKADHLLAFDGSITNRNVKKTYRVVTLKEPPFVFKERNHPGPSVTNVYHNQTTGFYYFGYCIDLIYKINETLRFDFVLYEPADGAYGSMQDDASWNGMVWELMSERADIAVAPLSVMAERENVIDFTVPYYDLVGITILMKKPTFTYSVFRFMSVLEEAVWGCVLSAFIIVSVLLAVFDRFSPYSYQNNKNTWDGTGEEPRIFSLKEGLWFCMTSLTPQGGGEAPRALSGRLVAATWWMFGFIMIATYTANLAAFLTVSRLDQPIESLDDLAKQFKTKYAPQNSTSTATYFRRMADIEEKFYTIWKAMSLNDSLDKVERAKLAVWDYPVSDKFTNMWMAMNDSGFPQTFEEALARVKRSNEKEEYVFIGDATQNKYAVLTDCDLWEVGEEFSRKPYALAVQDGSPLKNELSSVILQLLNQRYLEDLKTEWWEFNKTVCDKIEDESDGISIQNIGGVFLVIFIGIGLGIITLAFEYYWYKWRPQHNSRQLESQNKTIAVKSSQGVNNDGFTNTS